MNVRGPDFESLHWRVFRGFAIFVTSYRKLSFQDYLEDLLKIIFSIFKNLENSYTRLEI